MPVVHLVLIWVISAPSPLTCSDSWFDPVEGQLTAAESSSRFKTGWESSAAILGGPMSTVRQSENAIYYILGALCPSLFYFYYTILISGALHHIVYSFCFVVVPLYSIAVSLTLRLVSVCLHLCSCTAQRLFWINVVWLWIFGHSVKLFVPPSISVS